MSLSYEAAHSDKSTDGTAIDDLDGYDEYGFKKVDNGYYSKVTNSLWDSHPHQEEREQ